jgi:error-prone DNA polymerase
VGATLPGYAELHCLTNFSFQRGASHPEELVARAQALGYEALAITDECSVAGVVRAWTALRDQRQRSAQAEAGGAGAGAGAGAVRPFRLLLGSEFTFGSNRLVAIARNLNGWGNLCEFITTARRAAPKGQYRVDMAWFSGQPLADCEILFVPQRGLHDAIDLEAICDHLTGANAIFDQQIWLAAELTHGLDDALWLATLREAGARTGVPLVAAGDVHMHVRSRKVLQDVLTAVRLGRPVAECGMALQPNAERRLRHRLQLARIFPPELLANTLEVARRCTFALDEIRYNYPRETVPPGLTPTQALRRFTLEGAHTRYPQGLPCKLRRALAKELRLIAECGYEMFFLTVHDIVRFARSQHILCQGRGSAANSAVCYCLGITAVDPMHSHLLLERFISHARRHEPPDIDVDFEHERREEVIQYIYRKYGRERAAIAAVVITWRTRSAVRDVGKALGLPGPLVEAFAQEHQWFDKGLLTDHLRAGAAAAGLAADDHRVALWVDLTRQIMGFPRHLSQHVGGFVLTQDKLTRLVPVENAAMADRSVIQWEKDDLEAMGLMKVDVLALGMLSAIRRCLDLRNGLRGGAWALHHIPQEDPATYDLICQADTVGVFQIESRAQMSMLPRLQPRVFYDLVIEVAIVRPGPIQGGMVHPYLKARDRVRRGLPVTYESEALKPALQRTLGVPIFQEQVMQIAMIAAGFSGAQADALRRSMAAWKRRGGVHHFYQPMIDGMTARGYRREFAESIFQQILGFGEYGFPESHAYSFALITYVSCWLKRHEPACFLTALLNAQPLGFYTPSQLVQDARRHGIEVRPADVSHSDWDCTLEKQSEQSGSEQSGSDSNFPDDEQPEQDVQPAVRLGLRLAGGLSEAGAQRIMAARAQGPFTGAEDLALRAQLDLKDLNALAAADALHSLSGQRRQQVWDAAALQRAPALLRSAPVNEAPLQLPTAPEGEEILFDYAATGLTLRRHPLALLRPRLARLNYRNAQQLDELPDGRRVAACGIVTVRQQPQTAHGTIFVTLEDETGPVNVIVWRHVREQQREALLHSRLLGVHGVWQRDVDSGGQVRHLVAHRLTDLTPLLGRLGQLGLRSRDFH